MLPYGKHKKELTTKDMVLKLKNLPFLRRDRVHICLSYLPNKIKNIPYFISILSENEYQKAYSFKFSKDQQRFIIARGILRCLLGRYLGTIPKNIEIIYNFWGKPYLSTRPTIYFNLSHSKDYVLYAFTNSYEIGIDLEYIDPTLDIDSIIPSILFHEELYHWNNVNQENKIKTFFKVWVYKEAFLKAYGKGWSDNQPILFNYNSSNYEAILKLNNNYMVLPYYFTAIPNYASAFFINGPFLQPLLLHV